MKRYLAFLLLAVGLMAAMPRLVRFSGTAKDARITFALYAGQTGGAPLWVETQNVQTGPGGHYTVLLGATKPEGLPANLFASELAHWVGVTVEGQAEQPRVLLVSAPYALNAEDAETLGGRPPSAFVLAAPAVTASGAKPEARDVSPDTGCPRTTSDGTATPNEVARFTGPCAVEPSAIFESAGKVGIGSTAPAATLDVKGTATVRSTLTVNAKGTATASSGANSNPLDLLAASFASTTDTSISQHFRWQAEAAGNDTASPAGSLNLLYAQGSGTPAETGLSFSSQGDLNFAPGQTFSGTGTITGITAGSGLAGGGTSGAVSVSLTGACAGGQVLQWNGSKWACAALGAGTITAVTAGAGLSGGGSAGNITLANTGVLAVGAGTGITSTGGSAPAVSLNAGFTDGRYLRLAGGTLSGALNLVADGLTVPGNQFVQAGGNLGIGTASPGAPLEVAGSVKISGAGTGLTFPDGTKQTTAGNPALLGVNLMQVALLKWFPAYQASIVFAVGTFPKEIVFDGANLWVTNYTSGNVTKLQASTGALVGTYKTGNDPYGIAFDGANVWVSSNLGGVTKLLASTGATVGTYTVGTAPAGVAFDGANIWVANQSDGTVSKLLASTGAPLGTFTVGSAPAGVAFDGANIWVTNFGSSTVTKLLASTGTVVGTYNVGSHPYGIVFDGTNIWTANSSAGTVTKLLASTGSLVGTYSAGGDPGRVAFDGANIWVTNADAGTVTKLLAATGATVAVFNVGNDPLGVAFDGANIWVANGEDSSVSKL